MVSTKRGNAFAIAAAVLFIVYGIWDVAADAVYMYETGGSSAFSDKDIKLIAVFIGFLAVYIIKDFSIAVTLLLKNKKWVSIPAGIYAVIHLGGNICLFIQKESDFISWDLFNFLAYIVLFIIIILISNKVKGARFTGVLPAVIFLAGFLFIWISNEYFSNLEEDWQDLILNILEVLALLFTGLCIMESSAKEKKVPMFNPVAPNYYPDCNYQQPDYNTQPAYYNPQPTYNSQPTYNPQPVNNPTDSGNNSYEAEKLRTYKKLFDEGVLTKEEFEAKKRETLGL